jgi:rare lipoprotein A (peptidoglycan hydrolase)
MFRFRKTLALVLFGCLYLANANAQFNSPAETGSVGVYDDKLHGSRTALGALYDMNQLTCAHKFYPTGTLLQIARIDNGQSVVVEVNDRLSVKMDEVIRVSRAAARQINLDPSRVTIVRIDPLGKPKNTPTAYYNTSPSAVNDSRALTAKGASVPQSYDAVVYRQPVTVAESAPKLSLPSPFGSPASASPQSYADIPVRSSAPTQSSRIVASPATPRSYDNLTARGIVAETPVPQAYDAPAGASFRNVTTYYVQIAAFSNYANADRYYQNLVRRGVPDVNIMQVQASDGGMLYRMRVGPFSNVAEANNQKNLLGSEYGLRGLVMKGN